LRPHAPAVQALFSQIVGAQVFPKFENVEFSASFKECGGLNKLAMLLESGQPLRSVTAALAGNQAQGVAHHAPPWAGRRPHRLGCHRRTHD
jgi:threonine dehydratase